MNQQAIDSVRKSLANRWTFLWNGWGNRNTILDLCLAFEHATPEAQALAGEVAKERELHQKSEKSLLEALAQITKDQSKIDQLQAEIVSIKSKTNWNRQAEYEAKLADMKRELDASKDLFQANLAAVTQELVRVKRGNDKLLKFVHETKRLDEPFNPDSIRGILQAETNKRLKPRK